MTPLLLAPLVKVTKGWQPWVTEIPQKGEFEEEHEARPPSGGGWWGNRQKKALGSHRAPLSYDSLGSAQGPAAVPSLSPCPPSWPTAEVQPFCLALVVLPLLLTIILMFPNLRSITAKGKVGRDESPVSTEHPQRTVGTKPERGTSGLGQAEKREHLLCLKSKEK